MGWGGIQKTILQVKLMKSIDTLSLIIIHRNPHLQGANKLITFIYDLNKNYETLIVKYVYVRDDNWLVHEKS